MNQEKIRERKGTFTGHEHNHAGQHSFRQRLDSAFEQFREWRNSQEQAHLTGHKPDSLPAYPRNPYLPEGEGTEIELFVSDEVKLAEVRQALADERDLSSNQ